MNSKKITLIVAATAVAVGASIWFFLTKTSTLPKYIPNSASFVFKLNPLSIGRKIDFDEIKKMKSFEAWKDELKKGDLKLGDALQNPQESGISFTDNIYVFAEEGEKQYSKTIGAILPVSDAETLKKFIEKLAKNSDYKYEKSGDLHVMTEKEPELESNEDDGIEPMYRYKPQITTIIWNEEACLIYSTTNNCLKTAKKIMAQPKEQSMLAVESFNKSESEGGDASMYINYEKYMSASGMKSLVPKEIMGLFDNIAGSAFVLNFNDNNISADAFSYYKDQKKAEEFAFLQNKGLSDENLEVLSPDGKLLIGTAAMLNMEAIVKFLKTLPQYKTSIKEIANTSGLTENEIETMLDGSIAFAMTKLNTKEVQELVYNYENFNMETGEFESSMQTVTKVVPVMTAQIGLKDEKIYKKIISQLEKISNGMIKENNGVVMIPGGGLFGNISMVFAKNKLVFTNDEDAAKSLAKNKTWNNQLDKNVASILTDNPSSFFMDMTMKNYGEASLKKIMNINDDNESFSQFKDIMSNFKDLSGFGTMSKSNMQVNFSEGKDNTIMRLIKMADTIATAERKKDAERKARMRELESQLNQEAIDSSMVSEVTPEYAE